MNSNEFKALYVGAEEDGGDVGGEGCKLVDSEEVINGKHIHYSYIYAVGDQFFCVEEDKILLQTIVQQILQTTQDV